MISRDGDDVLIRIKVVPGARSNGIAGVLGDRLKIRVSAPPEGGRANKAVCAMIAAALGAKPRQVSVESGQTSPEKVLRISGVDVEMVARLSLSRRPDPPDDMGSGCDAGPADNARSASGDRAHRQVDGLR